MMCIYCHVLCGSSVCADVTVKIVTLPEDQLRQMEGEGEGEEVESGRNGRDRDQELTNAMSLFLDSLLVSLKIF